MNIIKIQYEKIDVDEAISFISSYDCGAISIFIGTTRNNFNNMKVLNLEYETSSEMAYLEINKICNFARQHWADLKNITVIHRIGVVPIGESSILIASNSPHRNQSLEGTKFLINEIKKRVPIWKKEIYEDNEEWKENSECEWIQKSKPLLE